MRIKIAAQGVLPPHKPVSVVIAVLKSPGCLSRVYEQTKPISQKGIPVQFWGWFAVGTETG